MTRNLLRLAVLVFALSTTFFGLTPPPSAEAQSCGSGGFFVRCTKKCCGSAGGSNTYVRTGFGTSCTAAKSACSSCLPACPSGQSPCGTTFATCGF